MQPLEHNSARIYSLDGLRGIACLVVFFMHMAINFAPDTSLGVLISGTASVMVFFVLSGVVLSLAPMKRLVQKKSYDWLSYFPRRIARLCIPTFAAIALAIPAGFVAYTMGSDSKSAQAIDFGGSPLTILHDIFMQFDVFFNVSDDLHNLFGADLIRVNSPVWSMSWELWFSITLPLAIFCIAKLRRDWLTLVLLIGGIFIGHAINYFPLRLILMFWIGVVIAKNFDKLSKFRMPIVAEIVAVVVAIGIIEARPILDVVGITQPQLISAVIQTLMNSACAFLVVIAGMDGTLRKALSSRVVLFFGQISFSLYLTHAIVIGGLRAVLPKVGIGLGLLGAVIATVICIAFAYIFYRLVERPSMLWSRTIKMEL